MKEQKMIYNVRSIADMLLCIKKSENFGEI